MENKNQRRQHDIHINGAFGYIFSENKFLAKTQGIEFKD
jgi:hypothetical protein